MIHPKEPQDSPLASLVEYVCADEFLCVNILAMSHCHTEACLAHRPDRVSTILRYI